MNRIGGRCAAAGAMACALAMGAVSSAGAAQVYYQDFESLNGGASADNYTGTPGVTVISGGVDLVHNGDNGILCPISATSPSSSSCLDLEGANGTYGRIQSAAYEAHAGDTVTLSFLATGNQRSPDPFDPGGYDQFFAGFRWAPTVVNVGTISLSPDWMLGPSLEFPGPAPGFSIVGGLAAMEFRSYAISFVAPVDLMVSFRIGGGSPGTALYAPDDRGVLIDEIALDITTPGGGAVPEPATWAMMLMGFGGLGAALRRRRVDAVAAQLA